MQQDGKKNLSVCSVYYYTFKVQTVYDGLVKNTKDIVIYFVRSIVIFFLSHCNYFAN